MTASSLTLTDEDMPGLFEASDMASGDGQRRYVTAVRLRLTMAVLAAVAGVFTLKTSFGIADAAAVATALALVVVLGTELYLKTTVPDAQWYDGRALAESAKSLAWRFSVGADPYGTTEEQARHKLVSELAKLLKEAPTEGIVPSSRPAISPAMVNLRSADLSHRMGVYLSDRIENQSKWYSGKALLNAKLAARWRVVLLCIEVIGIAAALSKAFGLVSFDLAGVVAALIGAGSAWIGVRQYTSLSRAYTFAANELGIIRARIELIDPNDEEAWAAEAADAEEAISREHTMWRASRSRPTP